MAKTSLHDKKVSNEILIMTEVTFYGVFLALIAMADSDNLLRLERAGRSAHLKSEETKWNTKLYTATTKTN